MNFDDAAIELASKIIRPLPERKAEAIGRYFELRLLVAPQLAALAFFCRVRIHLIGVCVILLAGVSPA
jgi:hypothetical protein